jgi:hypothetical protein
MENFYSSDIKIEFCKVIRNHVAFSPARKTHSISVPRSHFLRGNEPCPLVLRYGFLHHLPRTLKISLEYECLLRYVEFYFELE